jgi:23S rRNA (cytidine1920-2'-O)/16S rRNA (cytidine1409-2'-O)-methyltransferase
MGKKRLDVLLAERKLAESRSQAQRLIMAGQVRVNGQMVIKPSDKVADQAVVTIESGPRFVSRGGEKLEAALHAFGFVDLSGCICADVGASTGGFTDCLLQHGAKQVFAIDVGYGELHWKLRNDLRVVTMERTNARFVKGFDQPVHLITIDASFISLRVLLPVVRTWFGENKGTVIALIKPQFEAGRAVVARGGGVVRDPEIHHKVIHELFSFIEQEKYLIKGLIRSPLLGPKGNTEFLVSLEYPLGGQAMDWEEILRAVFSTDENIESI